MDNELKVLLAQILLSLEKAEQLCPKPVMSTPIGADIAAASHNVIEAYRKASIIDKFNKTS